MAHARYYSPLLERPLITALYHAAKARRIPMTRLASSHRHAQLCAILFSAFSDAGDFALARVEDGFKGGGMTGRGRNPFAVRRAAFHGVNVAQSVVQRQRVI